MSFFYKLKLFAIRQYEKLQCRPSVFMSAVFGCIFLAFAFHSDHQLAEGWTMQVIKDIGVAFIGVVLFYGSTRVFNHVRMHNLIKNPEYYSWKHIALAVTFSISCAFIIGSALQSAL